MVSNNAPSGSSNWITSFTLTVHASIKVISSPANWTASTNGASFISWNNTDIDPPFSHDIPPGRSLSGFEISSPGAISASQTYYLGSWNHMDNIAGPVSSGNIAAPYVNVP